jgi:hypothetical protein
MLGRHVYQVTRNALGEWVVSKDGERKARATRPTKEAAIDLACELARQDKPSKVIVNSGHGSIEKEHLCGPDFGELPEGG